MHVRDIQGYVIRSYTSCPLRTVSVPSLGVVADRIIDALGYETSTLLCIYTTCVEAAQLKTPLRYFTNQMVAYGMPRREASLWWDVIDRDVVQGQNGEASYVPRDRVDLSL